jgi:hypothetical protein
VAGAGAPELETGVYLFDKNVPKLHNKKSGLLPGNVWYCNFADFMLSSAVRVRTQGLTIDF